MEAKTKKIQKTNRIPAWSQKFWFLILRKKTKTKRENTKKWKRSEIRISIELNQDLILGDSVSTIYLRSFGSPGFILLLHFCYQWISSGCYSIHLCVLSLRHSMDWFDSFPPVLRPFEFQSSRLTVLPCNEVSVAASELLAQSSFCCHLSAIPAWRRQDSVHGFACWCHCRVGSWRLAGDLVLVWADTAFSKFSGENNIRS